MVTIRQATLEDAAWITRLTCTVQNIHAEAAPYFYKTVTPDDSAIYAHVCERLGQDDYVFYIAEIDKQAVGHILCFIRKAEDNPYASVDTSLTIDQMSVEEAFRGTGVADTLMQQALDLARQYGISRVSLGVWAFNERAIAFYKKHGFEIEHHRMVANLG